jgi:hypothetical protein
VGTGIRRSPDEHVEQEVQCDAGEGDGRHKLPIKADVRKAISKQAGDTVTVQLEQRLDD